MANLIACTYKSVVPVDGLQKLIADFECSYITEEEIKTILQ
jgi:hypothetical protein